jgi:Mn2+/Fe2+ NRAMP family transporter
MPQLRRGQLWTYFGPAFVASIAYIDPGNFVANIDGGSRFGYKLLWVLLWSNAMAILVQYLSAKLGIVTGRTLPQNCRDHFSRPMTIFLWVAAEISAVATDLAEFLGAALGFYLLVGPAMMARGMSHTAVMLSAGIATAIAVYLILALELWGFRFLEYGIMFFVFVIGACYAFEVFLVHPDWHAVAFHTIVPMIDRKSAYVAVAMLGATVMPHVVYLHSGLVQPRLAEELAQIKDVIPSERATRVEEPLQSVIPSERAARVEEPAVALDVASDVDVARASDVDIALAPEIGGGFSLHNKDQKNEGALAPEVTLHPEPHATLARVRHLRFELVDVLAAMNGAWLINSAMVIVAAAAFVSLGHPIESVEEAHHTLGPLLGPLSATLFAIALLCSGLSSSTVGTMAGQMILEGFLDIKFSIFLRRFITLLPALIVLGLGLDAYKVLLASQALLSFTLPFALVPLLILTNRAGVMRQFTNNLLTRVAGWTTVSIILGLNAFLVVQLLRG